MKDLIIFKKFSCDNLKIINHIDNNYICISNIVNFRFSIIRFFVNIYCLLFDYGGFTKLHENISNINNLKIVYSVNDLNKYLNDFFDKKIKTTTQNDQFNGKKIISKDLQSSIN